MRPGLFLPPHADLWARSEAVTQRAAAIASRTLRGRWPEAEAVIRDGDAADGIVRESRRWHAHALVLGWRGHGRFRRLLMGSVSRDVLRRAHTPVLVARRAVPAVTSLVMGVDGSAAAERAVRFIAHCEVPRDGTVTLVTVLASQASPSHPLLPGLTADLRADLLEQEAKLKATAGRRQKRLARVLESAGWRVRAEVRSGAPLYELLQAVEGSGADALVVGATTRRSTLKGSVGSVAEGAVDRSAAPVLVVP